jgi:uncharacterized membrane protein YebE (DUF533 family)
MKVRALLVVIAMFGIGAGGMLAYDAYQEHERQKMLETLPPPANCSTCALHKADQKRLREYNAKRSLLEKSADPNVE